MANASVDQLNTGVQAIANSSKCPLKKNKQARVKDDSNDTTDHDTEAGDLDTDTAEEIQAHIDQRKPLTVVVVL